MLRFEHNLIIGTIWLNSQQLSTLIHLYIIAYSTQKTKRECLFYYYACGHAMTSRTCKVEDKSTNLIDFLGCCCWRDPV